jgi:hypothetical protein
VVVKNAQSCDALPGCQYMRLIARLAAFVT